MAAVGSQCIQCGQVKPHSEYSKAQLKKNATSRTCMECVGSGGQNCGIAPATGQVAEVEPAGSKICYFCGQWKTNKQFSTNQLMKAKMGLGSCRDCVEAGHWLKPGQEHDDFLATDTKLCSACGNWKPATAFSATQCKKSDAPKCAECAIMGREALDRFRRHDVDSRSLRPLVRPRSRSKSSSSASSSSRSKTKKKKKRSKKKRKKKSSSSSSSSSSSVQCAAANDTASAAPPPAEDDNEEDNAKRMALEQLLKLKSVEPKDARMKDFRSLLRQWHPDKHPETKLATVVFQFLQKGRALLD